MARLIGAGKADGLGHIDTTQGEFRGQVDIVADELLHIQGNNSDGMVLGMACLELVAVYHNLSMLSGVERREYRAWRQLLANDLAGRLYGFKIDLSSCQASQRAAFSKD